jgi:hypothetical protein
MASKAKSGERETEYKVGVVSFRALLAAGWWATTKEPMRLPTVAVDNSVSPEVVQSKEGKVLPKKRHPHLDYVAQLIKWTACR